MTRKRSVSRPYRPAYCSAETLCYLLDISRTTLDEWLRLGHLPEPLTVGTQRRWRFEDIDTFILARNGRGDGDGTNVAGSEPDQFRAGVARVVEGARSGTAGAAAARTAPHA